MLWFCTIVCVFCLMTTGRSHSEESTYTNCIPLKDCPYAMNMVYTDKYAPTTIEFLKKFDCGHSKTDGPLIQCPLSPLRSVPPSDGPDCITSTGKKGTCKDINDCSTIRNTFVAVEDFKVCMQSEDNEEFKMKICCFEPEYRRFFILPPKGYPPPLIPIEDSTLQVVEPKSIEIVSNDLNDQESSTNNPNIRSTNKAPHDMNKQEANAVYQDFLNDFNKQVGESDNLHFAIMNEDKNTTRSNSNRPEKQNNQSSSILKDDSNNLVPKKSLTRQAAVIFPDSFKKTDQRASENQKPGNGSPNMVFPEDPQEEYTRFKSEILRSKVEKKKNQVTHPTNRIIHSSNRSFFTNVKTSRRVKRQAKDDNIMTVRPVKRPQSAKLRPLALTPENSEASGKSRNIETRKVVSQVAKLRPLPLTAENSEHIKVTESLNGTNGSKVRRKRSAESTSLQAYKRVSQPAKLRPLTLTSENSKIVKVRNSLKGSNGSRVRRKRSNESKNLKAHKRVSHNAKLRPLTLTAENSEIIQHNGSAISRRRREIRNSNDKYSRNLDFGYYDKNNYHKSHFYPHKEHVNRMPRLYFHEDFKPAGDYFFGPPPRRPSEHFPKPPYHPGPYFPPRNFYENNDVEMIDESDFHPTNKPRFIGSPRGDRFACGREGRRDRNRIIGGVPVALGEYPWMALLQYTNNNQIRNGCGGSLINSQYILTAAHCVDDSVLKVRKIKVYRVVLGEFDTSRDPDCVSSPEFKRCAEPSRIYGISKIMKHPKFDSINAEHDIALARLDREVTFSDYIKPICLPPSDFKFNNESVMIAGWGRTKVGGTFSEILNKAVLPIVDKQFCNRLGVTLTSGQICLGLGNGIDTCTGDSGGAIMAQKMEDVGVVTYQYGIISYGFASEDCGKAPSVNTFVPFYLDWIYSMLNMVDY